MILKAIRKLSGIILLTSLMVMSSSYTVKEKTAWQLYNREGNMISYPEMFESLKSADVILFGELHNNTISHWLQLELTMDLYGTDSSNLILGAEMFESDNQLVLDEYIAGEIRDRDFEAGARLWNNYKTDYKPVVVFAVEKGIPFVATNIPRRYAALVNQNGFEALDSLSAEAKSYIAPLPVPYDPELPGYKAMTKMGGPAMHANENLPKAQASKDATMAWFISSALSPGKRFLHLNGSYHSDNYEGIVWYLKKYNPGLKVMTISTVEQEETTPLDEKSKGKADFILVVNERVTKTY